MKSPSEQLACLYSGPIAVHRHEGALGALGVRAAVVGLWTSRRPRFMVLIRDADLELHSTIPDTYKYIPLLVSVPQMAYIKHFHHRKPLISTVCCL